MKEHYIPDWASHFQNAGFAVLIYDHRGWGSSEGQPRNAINLVQQAEDYHDAVIFARSLPSGDPKRIALWGIGHSGGASMIAAGDNPYIKAAILVMPFISGSIDAASYPPGIVDRAWNEREAKCAGIDVKPIYVPIWDESAEQAAGDRGEVFLHGPEPFNFIKGAKERSHAAGTPWKNEMSLESYYHISITEPRDHIHKTAPRSMLYLAATTDSLSGPIEEQMKAYEMAGEPKEFVTLHDHHINNYFGQSFEVNIKSQVRFLEQ